MVPVLPRLRVCAVLALTLVVAGCTGTAAPSASGSAGTAAPSSTGAGASDGPGTGPSGTAGQGGTITVYSGRSEELVAPVFERFTQQTGIRVEARYGDSAELAATILEEGRNSPADVFFAQDAGSLGAVAGRGLLAPLAADLVARVDAAFRSPESTWVGVSGRARVAAYNTQRVQPDDLPASILDFTDPKWKGRLGWVPTNASFQAFVTALRKLRGDEAARGWLEGIEANEPRAYERNSQALEAVAAGEVDVAFVNHYYLLQATREQGELTAQNHFFSGGDPGSLVNVAGVGVLGTARNAEGARAFADYLLSADAQRYFAEETFEYPLVQGVTPDQRLPALADIESPDIDLNELADLEATLQLLQEVGVL